MPTRSPGDVPAGTIRDLRLPGRALTALARAGITGVDDLAVLTRRDLAAIEGLGPAMIAAIRLAVPEPPPSVPRSGSPPEADHEELVVPAIDPELDPSEEEPPASPEIPSFHSLRAPRRRTAADLLIPGPPSPRGPAPAPARAPRAADYTDLLRLVVRAARAVAAVPGRVALRVAQAPVRSLGRLLGH